MTKIAAAIADALNCGCVVDEPAKSGVYIILNTASMRVYVGQSRNIRQRWRQHRNALRRGMHSNKSLQADWSSSGEECFRFHVAALLSPVDALAQEKRLTAEAMVGDCYNTTASACPGRSASGGAALTQKTIRLPPDLWAKIDANGLEWLRGVIRRARPPAG